MKRASRRKRPNPKPSPDRIRRYAQAMANHHQTEWKAELMDAAPHWEYMLGLHLRLVELEHLEDAVEELL